MDWHFSGTYVVVDPLLWVALGAGFVAAGFAVFLVTRDRRP